MSRCFFGLLCFHRWEEVDRFLTVGTVTGRHAGIYVELRCKHCGAVKWRGLNV